MSTSATANPVAEAAAKIAATSTLPTGTPPAAPEVAAPAESEQQAFSPDTQVQLERRGSGTTTMPREWLDSTKEFRTNNRGQDAFGALSAGDDKGAPADLTSGGSVPISDEEAAADEGGITSGTSVKVDGEAEAEDAQAGDAAEGEGQEASEAEKPAEETEAAAETETEAEKKPPAKVDLMKQGRQIRRTALDAMRVEAEKRQLEQRMRDEQTARTAAETKAREAEAKRLEIEGKLKTAPLAERLAMLGLKSKDELLEMALKGELPEPAAQTEKPAEQQTAADPEREALKKRLDELEARDRQRDAELKKSLEVQQQTTKAAAAVNVKAMLSAPEIAPTVRFTLATPGAINDVMARAEETWIAAGSVKGTENRHIIAAAKEAEAILSEQYAPILAAAGAQATPAKPAAKQTGPVVPQKPAAVAKPNVSGKRLGTGKTRTDDDLSMDPMLRDAQIKREMGWGGTH